jgi:hypothetical protein
MPECERMLYLLNGSMIGFAVAGAFLSVAYYPHIFILTALMISTRSLASTAQANSDVTLAVNSTAVSSRRRSTGQIRTGRHAPPQAGRLRARQSQHEDKN